MLKYIITAFLLFSSILLYSQSPYNFVCGTPEGSQNLPIGGGLYKPMKTLPSTNMGVFFRVLMVFVEFDNDYSGESYYWPPQDWPVYADQLFASEKQSGITAYEDYKISDYFNKISRDEFDVVADVYHVVLDHEYSYYQNLSEAQTDLFSKLDNDLNLNWGLYDLWRWNSNTQEYEMVQDNYIDMIYVQWRRVDPFGITWGGYGSSYVNYTTSDGKYITNYGLDYYGTGVTGINGANMPIEAVVGLFRHEYSHYTLGNHKPYCTVAGQDGTNMALGYEVGFSPMDMIAVGYDNTINFDPYTVNYSIGDLHSTGDLIKISTGTANEYFLVSNRRRIVGDGNGLIYDCNMAGDTAMGTPFRQFKDYSKGLYIYHVSNMNGFNFWADLECADGLWDWEYSHNTTPDWNSSQPLPVILKSNVSYIEDNPFTSYIDNSRMTGRDGHSVVNQNYGGAGYNTKWFSFGKRHTCLTWGEECHKGIDRIFTNLTEDWCSRECMGDRWDAWALDYNVVFSPYSSPNTNDRNNDETGIFIYYESSDGNTANLKIYKTDVGYTEDEILELTPPSKPMLYKYYEVECNNLYARPQIVWANNQEPDMLRDGGFKRYKIYRAITNFPFQYAPYNYVYIGTYDDCTPNDTASYIDRAGVQLWCDGEEHEAQDYFRYKVEAIDKYETQSVKSDFLAVYGVLGLPDKPVFTNNSPHSFFIAQNYPNPFNPSTGIRYSIPSSGIVSLKVYNLLGEEIAVPVNEYKEAGEYTVVFDGSELASGVYFYKLEIGAYTATKKMVLIK